MKYWVNFYNRKDSYVGCELDADTLEELINACMFNRDIVEVVEVIPDSVDEINLIDKIS